MTTIAMIAGMIPVALARGDGAETRVPMAVAIIGGLVSSTVLTLVVVPVFYSLLERLNRRHETLAADADVELAPVANDAAEPQRTGT
jgi:HAE1 family hydrophobic/amphiphilic exporter-1